MWGGKVLWEPYTDGNLLVRQGQGGRVMSSRVRGTGQGAGWALEWGWVRGDGGVGVGPYTDGNPLVVTCCAWARQLGLWVSGVVIILRPLECSCSVSSLGQIRVGHHQPTNQPTEEFLVNFFYFSRWVKKWNFIFIFIPPAYPKFVWTRFVNQLNKK